MTEVGLRLLFAAIACFGLWGLYLLSTYFFKGYLPRDPQRGGPILRSDDPLGFYGSLGIMGLICLFLLLFCLNIALPY